MFNASFLEDLNMEILKIYREIDERVGRFIAKTGISCLTDCGECCAKRKVLISPLEFIPLAFELQRRGELEKYLELARGRENEICVFYRSYSTDPKKGYCSFYRYRAATCRLYGFAFKRNKNGDYEPVTCEYLKRNFMSVPIEMLADNLLLDYDSITIRILTLCLPLAIHRCPPNKAILIALEKVGLFALIRSAHYENEDDTHEEKEGKRKKDSIER